MKAEASIQRYGRSIADVPAHVGTTRAGPFVALTAAAAQANVQNREPLHGSSPAVRGQPYHGPLQMPKIKNVVSVPNPGLSWPSFNDMCVTYRQGAKRGWAYGKGVRTNGYKNPVMGKNEPSSMEPPPNFIGTKTTSGGGRIVAALPSDEMANKIAQCGSGTIANAAYSIAGGYQRRDPSRPEPLSLGPYGFDTKKVGTGTLEGGWDTGMKNLHPPFLSDNPINDRAVPYDPSFLRIPLRKAKDGVEFKGMSDNQALAHWADRAQAEQRAVQKKERASVWKKFRKAYEEQEERKVVS